MSIHRTIGCIFNRLRLKKCQHTGTCQDKGIWTVFFNDVKFAENVFRISVDLDGLDRSSQWSKYNAILHLSGPECSNMADCILNLFQRSLVSKN